MYDVSGDVFSDTFVDEYSATVIATGFPQSQPNNILSAADSDFETGSPTWTGYQNATVTGPVTIKAFTGSHSFEWAATSPADTQVGTDLYPCTENSGYDFSGVLWTERNHDTYIGVQWYDSIGTPIGSIVWSQDFSADGWQSLTLAATSPVNAAQFKLLVWVGTNVAAGETFYIDLMYSAKTNVQILADWCNPAFFSQSSAGVDFFDLTPWVRLADNIQMTRGRQSRVSEMSAGSATFNVQNDDGWFTKYNSNSPIAANLGGIIDLGARCQINAADETGTWHTRFDGQVAEIDQNVEATGTTAIATFTLSDVLAYLNRQSSGLYCWTKSLVMLSGPWLHWSLDDANNAGSLGVATETSGNNGPALHPVTTNTATASIQWGNTNGGVETLADASAPGKPDMWEFWQAGSDTPSSDVNALESGVAGPYTTPLPSAYFTPNIPSAGGSAQNNFVTNSGYVLTGVLNPETGLIAPSNGKAYAIEAWYAMDPWIGTHNASNMGPYVVISLGNSRTGSCLLLGVWNSTNHLTAQAMTFAQPPAFVQQQYGTAATQIANVAAQVASDTKPLPHHFVANIIGSDGGATLEFFVDGTSQGTITLPAGVVYDTVTIGGAHGGWGCFYGNIQLASIYQRTLSSSEIQQHCNFGQYGMWESTTDNCIAQISEFANLPPFWNGLTAQSNGLSLTDYYDITNLSPLSTMQVYEQAEQGLLYVAANGAITFATRDQRQGHGDPDLMLPPDTYTSSLGYQLIDQYIINQVSVNTQTYQRGVVWQNPGSNNQYGPYTNGSSSLFSSRPPGNPGASSAPSYGGPGSSTSAGASALPLITWSRAYAALGLPQYTNSPDPILNDLAAWKVNTQSESRQTYSSLTVDLLTLDPASGLTVSQLYGLDINDVIGLSGVLPTSISNAALANELFLEGVNETIGLNQWTLELYTSPADVQRAWIPGDPVYGVLGSTSRVGLSAADTSPIPAIGKDVAHDAGSPYWPPSFIVEDAGFYQFGYKLFTGTTSSITGDSGLKRVYQGDAVLVSVMCPAASTITVGPDSQGNTYAQVASSSVPLSGLGKVGAYLDINNFQQTDWNGLSALWQSWSGVADEGGAVRYYAGAPPYSYTTDLQEIVATGARICISFSPAYNPPSSTDLASITSLLSTLKTAGADCIVTVRHEPFYNGLTAAQYVAEVQYYAPSIRQYYPFYCCFSGNDTIESNGYYPGDSYVDGIAVDAYLTNSYNYSSNDLTNAAAMADNHGKPLAIWEMGTTRGPNFLVADNHTFAATIGNWVQDVNCTLVHSAAVNPFGVQTGALGINAVTAGNMSVKSGAASSFSTQMQACAAGNEIALGAYVQANTTARTCVIGANFYSSSGTFISQVFSSDATATAVNNTTGWTPITGKLTAPASAAYYALVVQVQGCAAAEFHRIAMAYCADSSTTGHTQGGATTWWQWVQSTMLSRVEAGKPNGDVILFNAGMPGNSNMEAIQYPNDYRIGLWLAIRSALNNVWAWQYLFASINSAPLNSSDSIPVTGSLSQNYIAAAFGLENVLAIDGAATTASGTGTTSTISTADMPQPYDLELVVDFNNASAPDDVPPGWNYGQYNFGLGALYNSIFWKQNQGEYTGSWDFESGIAGWSAYAPAGTVTVEQSNAWANGGTYSLLATVTAAVTSQWYVFAGISDVTENDTLTVTATVHCHSPQAVTDVNLSVDWKTSTGTYLSTSGGPLVSLNPGDTQTLTFTTTTAPATTGIASVGVRVTSPLSAGSELYIDDVSYAVSGPITGDTFSSTHASTGWGAIALTFTMQPATLNNPSGSGNQFIGSLEMRGLHDTLMTALQPPMAIVGTMNHSQTIASGNIAAPEIVWDQIFADTAGGMSAIPGWQNWYVCTVPGFYEINGCARMTHNTPGGTVAGYLAIASQAAQAVAAGTATPETINAYVCPVGEQHQMNAQSIDLSMSASTRIYLGVGDMVALCMTQNTGASEISKPFSTMSIRWCGYSTVNDQVQFNSSLGGSGVTTNAPTSSGGAGGGGAGGSSTTTTKKTYQSVWGTTTNYAYWGTSTSFYPQLRSRNTAVYQGEYAGGAAAGSQFAVVVLNYSAIQSALSGATINWIKLTCKNEHFWYNSGGKLILGWSSRGPGWGNSYSPNGNDHMNMQQIGFGEGQQKTFYLGSWAKAIQSSAKALLIGNDRTTDLQYYSFWSPSFTLTVNYTK